MGKRRFSRLAVVSAVLAVCVAGIGISDASSGFPAPSAAPCPQSPTPQKGAVDKRTDATAVCYFLPEVYFTPSSGTVAVNQSFTFTLEVRYAEYGCSKTGAWSGSIATNSSGQYGPQSITVGPFGSPGTYTYGVSCGGLGGTNPGSTTVTVTAPGGGGPGSGGGSSCSENLTSQIHATFVSMSGVPASITAGGSFTASVTFQNTGACTWTAANGYRLGSQNPENNTTWGTSRGYLSASDAIAPGQSKTFTINAVAPSTAGPYGWGWRMVREGINWLGTPTNGSFTSISVTGSVPPQTAPPGVASFAITPTGRWTDDPAATAQWSCTNSTGASLAADSTAGGSWSGLPVSGSRALQPAPGGYTYTVTCSNNVGDTATAQSALAVFDAKERNVGDVRGGASLDPNNFDSVLKCRWKREENHDEIGLPFGLKAGGLKVTIDWCVSNGQIKRVARTVEELGANYPVSSWHYDGITSTGPCGVNCSDYVSLWGTNQTVKNIWLKGRWSLCATVRLIGSFCWRSFTATVGVRIRGDGTRARTYDNSAP